MTYLAKLRLDGRTALVTDGAGGIGAACVDALIEAGASIIIADYSAENLAAAKARLAGKPVRFDQIDVTRRDDVIALADRVDPVDILVNNAGIGRQTAAEDISEHEWNEVMAVNPNGVFWCAQTFGKAMVARGKGAIVNIGSTAGEIVVRPQKNVHYNASKAAVHHATKSMAAEWAPHGVRGNAVAPGFVKPR